MLLASQFETGTHPSPLKRRLAAIKFAFTCQQLPSPTDHPLVSSVLKGIRRDPNTPPIQQKKAATPDILKRLLAVIPDNTLQCTRDSAALLLDFAGAFRRSELLGIDIEHMIFIEEEGLDIRVQRSKTDQEDQGRIKSITKGYYHCPIQAVKCWLDIAHIKEGLLFRSIINGKTIKSS